jgi:hypothetical protein
MLPVRNRIMALPASQPFLKVGRIARFGGWDLGAE